jgi:hypothetical protein
MDTDEHLANQFEIMRRQIIAGNDNKEFKKFKVYIYVVARRHTGFVPSFSIGN